MSIGVVYKIFKPGFGIRTALNVILVKSLSKAKKHLNSIQICDKIKYDMSIRCTQFVFSKEQL